MRFQSRPSAAAFLSLGATSLLAVCSFATLSTMAGCGVIADVVAGLEPPTGDLGRVDLVTAPSTNDVLAWGCHEWFGATTCQLFGFASQPSDQEMLFSFDLVFDLFNPNENVPIPLVELLLGVTVLEDANLGAVCITFCDPDSDDECVPERNAEGSCEIEEATDVQQAGDIIPTVEDLVDIAQSVASGDVDNSEWRTIPPQQDTEAHIQFDFGIATMLNLAEDMIVGAVDDALNGEAPNIDIPYTAEGSMFFQAPELGRYALGFGPFEDTWQLN